MVLSRTPYVSSYCASALTAVDETLQAQLPAPIMRISLGQRPFGSLDTLCVFKSAAGWNRIDRVITVMQRDWFLFQLNIPPGNVFTFSNPFRRDFTHTNKRPLTPYAFMFRLVFIDMCHIT